MRTSPLESDHPVEEIMRWITAGNRIAALTLLSIVVPFCSPAACQTQAAGQGQLDEVWIHSRALENNRLEDSADKRELVYLPPSYGKFVTRRYPSFYFLHGFSMTGEEQGAIAKVIMDSMDQLIAGNKIEEMIVIIPDGRNSLGGSFYVNSQSSGNYEDYIVRDLVPIIDGKYRTIPNPASRGIAGHSMGGFGAIWLGFHHPDLFGAVYAMSPCCLEFGTDSSLLQIGWREALAVRTQGDARELITGGHFFGAVYYATAAAFSPNADRAPLFLDFPFRESQGKFQPNEPAYNMWRAYSGIDQAKARNLELLKLKGITIEFGTNEADVYIPRGSRELSQALAEIGIPHRLELFDGDHVNKENERIRTILIPFFSLLLEDNPDELTVFPTGR